MKKKDLAQRLGLRYATLLEWEKNRPEVYKRLILSYEYERALEQITTTLANAQKIIDSHINHKPAEGK